MKAGIARLSVVIPTRNGARRLPELLDALASQNDPGREWEVLVVDNNSTDGTAEVVRAFDGELLRGVSIRLVGESRQGVGFARQRGVDEAEGDWIAFLDDDTRPACDWLERALSFIRGKPGIAAVSGRIHPRFESLPPPDFERLASFFSLFDHGSEPRRFDAGHMDLPPGAGLLVSKADWLSCVPPVLRLATGPGDDHEALRHLHAGGREIWYCPDMRLEHVIPTKRLEADYLRSMVCEFAQVVCWLRMVGRPRWMWPLLIAEVVVGSGLRCARLLLSVRTHRDGIIRACERLFWRRAALSPLSLLRPLAKTPLPARLSL